MAGDWSDEQNDAIVADYFAMLADDVAGRSSSKAEHNRRLQAVIDRPRGSIEYKYQNISAVLKGFGEDWTPGYKPAFNFHASLIDAVMRWLQRHPDLAGTNHAGSDGAVSAAGRSDTLDRPSSDPSNAPPPYEFEQMIAIARKCEVAERGDRNRALGRVGEERVLAHERANLRAAGRADLAERIRWVSHVDGDGTGCDILSFDTNGHHRLIEMKTTNGQERTPFHVMLNELAVAEGRRTDWRLVRLWNFEREPNAFELQRPLEAHVSLMATSYQANFL